jgi:hypothetical protein
MRIFRKDFVDFLSGIRELQQVSNPAGQAIGKAMNATCPISAMVTLQGKSLDMVYKLMLIQQASATPFPLSAVYARANCHGFMYQTNRGNAFGWRQTRRGYRFFVRAVTFEEIQSRALLGKGWFEPVKRTDKQEVEQFLKCE